MQHDKIAICDLAHLQFNRTIVAFQGCNTEHGYCQRPGYCSCREGWSGPTCNECVRYPGCANGYCIKVHVKSRYILIFNVKTILW